jgi:hypothetical protein
MMANFATTLIGLSLAYRAIFSIPAGNLSQIEMLAAGIAVILLAVWARRTDLMGWPSGTTIVLGVIILLLAATHRTVGVDPLILFWMLLLIGVTTAIAALWSILYRPDTGLATYSR